MPTDKQQLQQKIANMEAELAEMKALLNKRIPTINYWQPKFYERYHFVNVWGKSLHSCYDPNHEEDPVRYRVFKTEAEAQKYAEYIKAEETIRKAIAEANEGWLPNWNSYDEPKFVMTLTYGKPNVRDFRADKYLPNFIYIKSDRLAQQLVKNYEQEFITYLSY